MPATPLKVTLRRDQEAEENHEAMERVETLTSGNNYTAQAAGTLQIFFWLLRNGGCGPSLTFFFFLKSAELDQATGNHRHKLGFFLALCLFRLQRIFSNLRLGSLRLHFRQGVWHGGLMACGG